MPNLRLSDQDAADVTSYMMEDPDGIFTMPEGWELLTLPTTWRPCVSEPDGSSPESDVRASRLASTVRTRTTVGTTRENS